MSKPRYAWCIAFCVFEFLMVTSCSHWQVDYLAEAKNRATQEEVSERFGPPDLAKGDLVSGKTVWTYQFRNSQVTGTKYNRTKGGPMQQSSTCTEYILTFGQDQVLREWGKRVC
jgi:hypothetical protein